MAINLTKGQSINLAKEAPGITGVMFGAGWDKPEGQKVDLDLSVFALTNGKCASKDDMIFYGHQKGAGGNIVSSGDNRSGEGDGDDETVTAALEKLPATVTELVAVLTRCSEDGQKQIALGDVPNAYIRAINPTGNKEVAKFEVKGNPTAKSLNLGKLVRGANGWEFTAVGEYSDKDLGDLSTQYGL